MATLCAFGRMAIVVAVALVQGVPPALKVASARALTPRASAPDSATITTTARTIVFHWSDNPLVLEDPRRYLLNAFGRYRETMLRFANAEDRSAAGELITASSVAGPGLYVAGDPLQSTRFGKNLLMVEILPARTIARAPTSSGRATADYFRAHPAIIFSTTPAIFYPWSGHFVSQHALVLRSPVMEAPWSGTLDGTEPLIDLDGAVSVTRDVPVKRLADHRELQGKPSEPLAQFISRFFLTWGDQLPLIIKLADRSQPLAPFIRAADGRLSSVGTATAIVEEIGAGPEPIAARLLQLERNRAAKERMPHCLPVADVCAASITKLLERTLLKEEFRDDFVPPFSTRMPTVSQAAALLVALEYLDDESVNVATAEELIEKLVAHWARDPRNGARAQNLLDSVEELRRRLEANSIDRWSRTDGRE